MGYFLFGFVIGLLNDKELGGSIMWGLGFVGIAYLGGCIV